MAPISSTGDPAHHCRPDAVGPPSPSLKSGSILGSAPPGGGQDDAGADRRQRMPPAAAAAVAPPSAAHAARKPLPGATARRPLVAPVAVEADGRSAQQRRRLGVESGDGSTRAARSLWCGSRGSRRLRSSVQRLSPMPAPARCTTASTPGQGGGIDGAGGRIPAQRRLARRPRVWTHHPDDVGGPRPGAGPPAGRTDEAARSGDRDVHRCDTTGGSVPAAPRASHRSPRVRVA